MQWWYGHNAVGFFLTTPILGIMYYFVPKAAGRPVYSYRLSVVHFWALVFVYIWAGPHHLLNTSLPDWAQTLGTVFSVMLLAPSWGGMVNGLLTLRGAWDRLRTDPILKFFVAAITFYGMSTFEGPLLSLKSVNGLAHYTDWIIGHVHGGALGWNGFMAAGMFYWLVPRLWNTKLHSTKSGRGPLLDGDVRHPPLHGLDVDQRREPGALLARARRRRLPQVPGLHAGARSPRSSSTSCGWSGGVAYLGGFVLMVGEPPGHDPRRRAGRRCEADGCGARRRCRRRRSGGWSRARRCVLSVIAIVLAMLLGRLDAGHEPAHPDRRARSSTVAAILLGRRERRQPGSWHHLVEGRPLAFTLLVLVAILVGGMVELIPTHRDPPARSPPRPAARPAPRRRPSPLPARPGLPAATAAAADGHASKYVQQPYSPLELEGRDIYVREGCYNCHSQMIRPFRHETLRYGEYSRLEEFDLRPPVPVGLEADRPRPAPGRREVPEPLALPAHDGPALDLARLQHAALSLAEDRHASTSAGTAKQAAGDAQPRGALHRRRHRRPPRRRRGRRARLIRADLATQGRAHRARRASWSR